MRRIRNRLTYANVVATLALVIAVAGGTAYAANTVFSTDIVDGEVKIADIGQGAVATSEVLNDTATGGGLTAADLRSGSVGSAEIATGGVRSADVQDDTSNGGGLTSTDLAEDSVGSSEFQFGVLDSHARTWSESTATNAEPVKELSVACPLFANGEEVTGGGYVISNNGVNVPSVVVQRSYAVSEHAWLVRAVATSGTPTWGLTVVANCIQ